MKAKSIYKTSKTIFRIMPFLFLQIANANAITNQELFKIILQDTTLQKGFASEAITQDLLKNKTQTIENLTTIINQQNDIESNLEARYRLALLLRFTAYKKALTILEEGLHLSSLFPNLTPGSKARALLLTGDIYLENFEPQKALKFYTDASLIQPSSPNLLILSNIAMGDAEFLRNNYEKALAHYEFSLSTISSQCSISMQNFCRFWKYPLLTRIIWSAFNSGNYKKTTDYSHLFMVNYPQFSKNISPLIAQDITRITGIALFEQNNVVLAEKFAANNIAGNLGKQIIIQMLIAYNNSGKYLEAEKAAASLETHFLKNEMLVGFLEERYKIASLNKNSQAKYNIAILIADLISQNSIFKKAVILSPELEAERSKLVAASTQLAAEYYLQQAKNQHDTVVAGIALKLLKARIAENIEPKQQGYWYLQTAHAANLALAWNEAASLAQQALQYHLTEEQIKNALLLISEAARGLCSRCENIQDKNYQFYANSIQNLLGTYANLENIQNIAFEFSYTALKVQDYAKAARIVEQLVRRKFPNTPSQINLRKLAISTLVKTYSHFDNQQLALDALIVLEQQTRNEFDNTPLLKLVAAANAATIRNIATQMRLSGDLAGAAKALFRFASQHLTNSETPALLVEISENFFEIGLWQDSFASSSLFLQNYPTHLLKFDARYWNGRALEEQLKFSSATQKYIESAFANESRLSAQERIDTLQRAHYLIDNINTEADRDGLILEKIAQLYLDMKNHTNANVYLLMASEKYLLAKQPEILKRLAQKITKIPQQTIFNKSYALFFTSYAKILTPEKQRAGCNQMLALIQQLSNKSALKKDTKLLELWERAALVFLQESEITASKRSGVTFGELNNTDISLLRSLVKESKFIITKMDALSEPEAIALHAQIAAQIHAVFILELRNAIQINPDANAVNKLATEANEAATSRDLLLSQHRNASKNNYIFEPLTETNTEKFAFWKSVFSENFQPGLQALNSQDIFLANKITANMLQDYNIIDSNNLSNFATREIILFKAVVDNKSGEKINDIIENIIINNPTWEAPYLALTEIYLDNNLPNLAEKVFRAALSRLNKVSEPMYAQGIKILLLDRKNMAALNLALQYNKNHPNNSLISNLLAYTQFSNNQYQDACNILLNLYTQKQVSPVIIYNHAICLIRKNQLDTASNILALYKIQYPYEPELPKLAGLLFKQRELFNEARAAWTDFLTLAPTNAPQRKFIETSLRDLGE